MSVNNDHISQDSSHRQNEQEWSCCPQRMKGEGSVSQYLLNDSSYLQIDTCLCFGYSLITHSPELALWRKGSLILQLVSGNPEVSAESTKWKTVASLCLCGLLCGDSLGQRDTTRKVTLTFPVSKWTGWAIWQTSQVKYAPPPHKCLFRPHASTNTNIRFLGTKSPVIGNKYVSSRTCYLL